MGFGETIQVRLTHQGPHHFFIDCQAGRPEGLIVSQRGVDVYISVLNPADEVLVTWDTLSGKHGAEKFGFVPTQSGIHQLVVEIGNKARLAPLRITRKGLVHAPWRIVAAASTDAVSEALTASEQTAFRDGLTKARDLWLSVGETTQAGMVWWHYPAAMEQRGHISLAIQGYRDVVALLRRNPDNGLLALAYHRLGVASRQAGQVTAAVEAFKAALSLRTNPDGDRAVTATELGKLYTFMGELLFDLPYLEEARRIYLQLGDQVACASVLAGIGWHYHADGDFRRALSYYDQGLSLVHHMPKEQVRLLSYQALTFLKLSDAKQALAALDQQAAIFKAYNYSDLAWAFWRINRAEALLIRKRYPEAEALLRRALEDLHASMPAEQAHLRFNLARAIRGQGRHVEALDVMGEALQISDGIGSQRVDRNYMVSRDLYADRYLDILVANGFSGHTAGLMFNEWRRQLMQGTSVDHQVNWYPEHWVFNPWHLLAGISDTQRHFSRPDETVLVSSLPPKTPIPPESLLRQFQSHLKATDQLLYFACGETQVYAWIVGQDHVRKYVLGSRAVLEASIRDYYEDIHRFHRIQNKHVVQQHAEKLTALLLKPLLPALYAEHLIIIPDGELYHLPFAALSFKTNEATRFMGAHFSMTFLSSLQQGVELMSRQRRVSTEPQAYIVAAPHYGDDLPELQGSLREAKSLEKHGQTFDVITHIMQGLEASKGRLLMDERVEAADYLHFASHANYFESADSLSALILSTRNADGLSVDRYLRPSDISKWRLRAQLVTLSACETALGDNIRIRGIGGLTEAFMDAGADGVLVSLWKIHDEATANLMDSFYAHLWAGTEAPIALQRAQLELSANPKWAPPFYWAGFIYIGRW